MDIGTSFTDLDLNHHSELQNLSYLALTCFLHCASMLKNDILLLQPHNISITTTSDVLPLGITEFLS
jgi:hypothetical protein